MQVTLAWLAIGWLPVLGLIGALRSAQRPGEGIYFSQVAMVTFGGAYAVRACTAERAFGTGFPRSGCSWLGAGRDHAGDAALFSGH